MPEPTPQQTTSPPAETPTTPVDAEAALMDFLRAFANESERNSDLETSIIEQSNVLSRVEATHEEGYGIHLVNSIEALQECGDEGEPLIETPNIVFDTATGTLEMTARARGHFTPDDESLPSGDHIAEVAKQLGARFAPADEPNAVSFILEPDAESERVDGSKMIRAARSFGYGIVDFRCFTGQHRNGASIKLVVAPFESL